MNPARQRVPVSGGVGQAAFAAPRGGPDQPPATVSAAEPAEQPAANIGAYFLFFLLFCSFSRVTDFVGAELHIPFVASIFCLLLALVGGNLFVAFRSPIGIAFTAFSICLIISFPFSVWRGGSFDLITDSWAKSFALFVVTAALLPTLRQNSRAVKLLAYAFLCTSLLGFVYGKSDDGRFGLSKGLYQGSNELATAMTQGCIYWWYMIHNPARSMPKRILSVLPLAPLLMIQLNTASRAGLIVLAVLMIMTFFRYSMQGRVALILVVVLGVTAGITLVPGAARERLATIFSSTTADDLGGNEALASKAQRAYLLKRSLELTLQHPLLGVGPGQFSVAENGMATLEGVRAQWLGTHNTYTQISSEVGIPALLCFLASLVFCWKELRAAEKIHQRLQSPRSADCLTAAYTLRLALISYVVFFCFEHIAYDPFYPALAGIIVAFASASRAVAAAATAEGGAMKLTPGLHFMPGKQNQGLSGMPLRA